MHLLLIRHGQSRSMVQADNETILPDDVNFLTHQGRAESRKLGAFLSARFPEVILFASPLPRADETANILRPFFQCEIIFDSRLIERRWGSTSGTTCAQSRVLQEASFTHPYDASYGEESVAEHRERVSEFLEERLNRSYGSNQTICLVTHGGTIEHVHGHLTGSPVASMAKFFINCGSASYHLWTRLFALDGRVVWRLDGIDLKAYP
jgi:broad specificity phosphatase PhoE